MNSRTFFAAAAVLPVIVLAALSAALPSALLPGNTAYAQTNSAPQFPSSETGTRTVDENTPWYQNIGDPVVATDPDDDKLTYSLENARTSPFTIDRFTGQLQTGAPLDYETQATYTAKVIAADRLEPDDPSRATDTITVTINVNNVDEPGKVSLTWTRLQVGAQVEASLTDPDGNVSGVTWHWEKSSDRSSWTAISTATQATYTPVEGDVNRYLRAVASYTDPLGAEKTAWSAAAFVKPVPYPNQTPKFQVNTGSGYDCSQGETADVCLYIKRHAPPGSEIHYPGYVYITDHDQVRYSIGGADAVKFRIGPLSGDLYTTDAHAYDNPGTEDIFEITITATDPSGLSDSIDVALRPSGSAGSPTVRGPEEIRYPENGTWPLATYSATASNPDRDIRGWIISVEPGGGGGDFFDIDDDGVLTFTQPPDYEDPADENGDNTYSFTITAYDTNPPSGRRPGRTSFSVLVTVADVNEPPAFSVETASRTIAENTTTGADIGAPVTAADPDTGDTPAYTLGGTDATFFDIDASTGQLQTQAALDYETKSGYTLTMTASDGTLTATVDVTVTITNIDEAGTVALSTNQPSARAETTAALTDPDEGVTGIVWQWERSSDGNTDWADIGTSSASYTPVDGDVGYHLRATASYTDGHGPGKTAQAASTQAVQAGANRPPEFDSATATREVPENTEAGENIGAPVTAADPDTGDTPAYTLEGADLDSFDIDSASGQIQTKSGVIYDHETKSSYSVTVKADDNNGGTATIDVTITVADVDEPPEFDSATATREVPENTEAGENIGAPVTAADPDTGDTPAYTLGGTDATFFDIDASTGQLQTKAALDYETKSGYTVTVTASDGTLTATVDVTVTVTNIDEAGTVALSTNQPSARAEITAALTDPDEGVTGAVWQWERSSDGNTDWADIGTNSPSYTPVDGDVGYHLRATASYTDGHGPGKTAQAASTQAVQAGANRPPEFDSATATREVPENTEAGGNIGAPVTAADPDTGDTPAYTLGGTDATFFDIDASTGQLQTQAALDYETKSGYTVTVTASDGALTATVDVTVTVTNVDEAGTVTLSTNQPPARAEITAALTDPDEGVTGIVWQWERSSDGNTDWADIGTSSASYTPVDGDVGYHLRATASYTDGHGPGKTAQAASTQAVQAGANRPPEFDSATATREVPENTEAGENIGAPVTAADPDTGDTPAYTLEGADLDSFDIDSASGQIQTKSGVTYDYETKSSYSVTVKADDNNGGTATIDVTITVADVDEPPEFDSATATREVPENTEAGENIGAPVTAADPDTGDTLTYTLEGADLDSFGIDSASGQIQTKSGVTYDHEVKSSYSVTVKADDNKGGTATIDVTITVADVNEPPEFSVETASRIIAENTTTGVAIGAPVTATDPDTGDTPAYTLGGTDATFFDIDASTGQLQTKAALDYETKSGYTVTVTASDGTLTATVDVTVTVTNIDEAGTVALSTNQPSARAEITAALTDPDEGVTGAVWQWERSSDGNTDWADIGTNSPSYTPVDGDVGYHLRATASYTDGHGPGKTAQAASTQAVQAGANRPPEFDSATATREVPENTEAGGNIGAPVTAADPDTGDTPAYTLGGTDATFFDIDASTGQLQTQAALDYETKSGYTVTVTASDGALTATVDVTVTVTNVDEAGTVTLSTNQPPARAEITAALTDPDEGVTGAVWQWERSSDGNTDWAGIGTSSPSYTPVDGDLGYHLRATASYTDGHGPGKTAQAASTQAVQAGANRPPEFDSATATREVSENTEAGENIGAPVTAADPDTGDTPAYTLEGADLDSFDIDSASGQIQTKSGVTYDHEIKSSYSVTVKADDNNGGTATIDVTITVADVDEPPEFDSATATREVPENTEAGGNIGVPVTAADPDTGDTLTYTLEGADLDSFDIDSASGQIQTKSGVTYDHEVKSSYSVTVKADDNNGGTATIDVTITVADVNEPPEFSVETASRTIAENTTTGVAIGAPVTAADPDTGDTPAYTLEGADLDSFDIDSASGQIQTKSGVTYDHETKSSYSVTVKADDNNGGTATIDVTITVADVDEPPEFDSATATREVPENTEAGGNIGAPVTAADPDTGDTPAYTLGGTDATFFDIDASTGQLQTKAALDYETKSGYTVTVTASDGTLTATVDVTVTVTNIDEAGTVALSTNQPSARAEITAALTDPDKGVTGAVWQWERSSDGNTDWADIGTSSPSYTPVDGDVGYHLRATASYTDGHGPGKTAQAASTQAVQAGANRPPEFDSATATREVPENTEAGENIGAPITANDPDNDTLTYTLGGADASSFDIGRSTGQITVGAGTALDYAAGASYTVSVTAADPSGSSAAIGVTIAVFDEDLGELGSRYDTDNDRVIGRDEAIAAIIDYFADLITRDEVVGVITLYFAS